jgi:type IV pilus assembly protein PilX
MNLGPFTVRRRRASEGGFVLVTGLVLLITLLLLGASLVLSTSSEEKIQRNQRDKDVAFAAATAALRDAELHLSGAYQYRYKRWKTNSFTADCSAGWCDSTVAQSFQPVDKLDFFSGSGAGANSIAIGTVTGSPGVSHVSAQPRYMIELVCATITGERPDNGNGKVAQCDPNFAFRITAQATGRLSTTRVVLQEIYRDPNVFDGG